MSFASLMSSSSAIFLPSAVPCFRAAMYIRADVSHVGGSMDMCSVSMWFSLVDDFILAVWCWVSMVWSLRIVKIDPRRIDHLLACGVFFAECCKRHALVAVPILDMYCAR